MGLGGGFVFITLDKNDGVRLFTLEDFVGQTTRLVGVDGGGHFLANGEQVVHGAFLGG
jgi:hypothetical protein